MTNKLISILLFSLFTITLSASGTCGETNEACSYSVSLKNGKQTLSISGNGAMTQFNINDIPWKNQKSSIEAIEITGVTTIGNNAFKGISNVTELRIPSSVKTINNEAFYEMEKLEKIIIDEGCETLKETLFFGCKSLKEVQLPSTIKSIGQNAFTFCPSLNYIIFKGTTKPPSCHSNAFGSSTPLKFVGVPEGYQSEDFCNKPVLPTNADGQIYDSGKCGLSIEKCKWVYNLNTKILKITGTGGMSGFATESAQPWSNYRKEIQQVSIEGITSLGWNAFHSFQVTAFELPNTLTSINKAAFKKCDKLKEIVLPVNIKTINEEAFSECTSLEKVTFEGNIDTIKKKAFSYTYKLKDVIVKGDTAPSKCEIEAFDKTALFSSVTITEKYKNNSFCGFPFTKVNADGTIKAYSICGNSKEECNFEFTPKTNEMLILGNGKMSDFTSTIAPWRQLSDKVYRIQINGIKSIGNFAFADMTKISSIKISSSVQSIGNFVFKNCIDLFEISVDVSNPYYLSDNGVLYSKQTTILKKYPPRRFMKSYRIQYDVVIIAEDAFANDTFIETIEIPKSLTTIQQTAFSGCTSLTKLILPANLDSIEQEAFENCTSLKSLTYEGIRNVLQCNSYAFSKGITPQVNVPSNYRDSSFCSFQVKKTESAAKTYQEGRCAETKERCSYKYEIDSNKLIVSGTRKMFDYFTVEERPWHLVRQYIQYVEVEDGLKAIGNYAFYGMDKLSSVVIGENVIEIGKFAFGSCKTIKVVTFDGSNELVCEKNAFQGTSVSNLKFTGKFNNEKFCGLNSGVSGLNGGVIAAIVVAVVVFLIAFFAMVIVINILTFRWLARRRNQINDTYNDDPEVPMANEY